MPETPELRMIPLKELKVSSDNMRRAPVCKDADEGLRSSILRHGVLMPLAVTRSARSSSYAVIAGSRRHRACTELARSSCESSSDWSMDRLILCNVISRRGGTPAGSALALGASLAENEVRQPSAYLDRFDQMQRMRGKGQSIADLTASLGISEGRVLRMLRIERVAPELREECRQGGMRIDQLEALSGTDDHELQKRIWRESGKPASATEIRTRVSGNGMPASSSLARYVGLEAYLARGGREDEGLFQGGRDSWLLDVDLVSRMAQERLEEAAQRKQAEGWEWVETVSSETEADLLSMHLEETPPPKDGWTPESRSQLGAVAYISPEGKEVVRTGLKAPSPEAPAAARKEIRQVQEEAQGTSASKASGPGKAHLAELAEQREGIVSDALYEADGEDILRMLVQDLAADARGEPTVLGIGLKSPARSDVAAIVDAASDLDGDPADALRLQLSASRPPSSSLEKMERNEDPAERAGRILNIDWSRQRPGEDYWGRISLPRIASMVASAAGPDAGRSVAQAKSRDDAAELLAACCASPSDPQAVEAAADRTGISGAPLQDLLDAFEAWPAQGLAPMSAVREAQEKAAKARKRTKKRKS